MDLPDSKRCQGLDCIGGCVLAGQGTSKETHSPRESQLNLIRQDIAQSKSTTSTPLKGGQVADEVPIPFTTPVLDVRVRYVNIGQLVLHAFCDSTPESHRMECSRGWHPRKKFYRRRTLMGCSKKKNAQKPWRPGTAICWTPLISERCRVHPKCPRILPLPTGTRKIADMKCSATWPESPSRGELPRTKHAYIPGFSCK